MLKSLPEFRLVAMRDTLPKKINNHEATVVNLDSDDHTGTHWTLIYNNPNDKDFVYYFDSFGIEAPNEVEKYLRTSGKKILMNSSQLQNLNSTMCGYFDCYVAKELSKGKSFYDVIYKLNQIDSSKNDEFLKNYFHI